jgi:hypothetical protein
MENKPLSKLANRLETQDIGKDDSDTFSCGINAIHCWKTIIEFLSSIEKKAIFIFGKNTIECSLSNESNTILAFLKIKTYRLLSYSLSSKHDFVPVCFELTSFRDILKQFAKKNEISLSKQKSSSEIVFEMFDDNPNRSYLSDLHTTEMIKYEIPDETRPKNLPNCNISLARFTSTIKRIVDSKPKAIYCFGYETGIVIRAVSNQETPLRDQQFGETSNGDSPKVRIFLKPEKFKNLAKLKNASSDGTVRFYVSNSHIKLITDVGNFGSLTVVMRDMSGS